MIAPAPLTGDPATTIIGAANRSWNDSVYGPGDPRTGNFAPDCDLTNPAANGECGALPRTFGQAVSATTYDPASYRGWRARQYNWEFSGSVQHELVRQVSLDVGYERRSKK